MLSDEDSGKEEDADVKIEGPICLMDPYDKIIKHPTTWSVESQLVRGEASFLFIANLGEEILTYIRSVFTHCSFGRDRGADARRLARRVPGVSVTAPKKAVGRSKFTRLNSKVTIDQKCCKAKPHNTVFSVELICERCDCRVRLNVTRLLGESGLGILSLLLGNSLTVCEKGTKRDRFRPEVRDSVLSAIARGRTPSEAQLDATEAVLEGSAVSGSARSHIDVHAVNVIPTVVDAYMRYIMNILKFVCALTVVMKEADEIL